MKIDVKPGNYVLAVSGGVDSVVLLDMLSKRPGLKLTVAHFDHGMRDDSAVDRRFVQKLAKLYWLPFVYDEGHLGVSASEAEARQARYDFLHRVRHASDAKALITAHHQDDLLETAILNMLRGTGRKGLTSLQSRSDIVRPLLNVTKNSLLEYASEKKLQWREDPTNQDTHYQRNYVRHQILPHFSLDDRAKLVSMVTGLEVTNRQLDAALARLLNTQANIINRQWFGRLPHSVAREMMAAWLRSNDIRGFDRKTLERLVTAAKTAAAGKQFPVLGAVKMKVSKENLALEHIER